MEDQQILPRTGSDSVGATLIVAELNEQSLVVKLFDDRTDLPAYKPLRGKVCQQCYYVQKGRPCALFCPHQSTQHVTNLGALSPVRTIQIVLTTALSPCRLMVASRRQ
jgi:hypothetical protein